MKKLILVFLVFVSLVLTTSAFGAVSSPGAIVSNQFTTNQAGPVSIVVSNATAQYFYGNGSGLSGITSNSITSLNASQINGTLPAIQIAGQISITNLPPAALTNTETGVTLSGTFTGSLTGTATTASSLQTGATNQSLTYPNLAGENYFAEQRQGYSLTLFTNWQVVGVDFAYGGYYAVGGNVTNGLTDNGAGFNSGEIVIFTNISGIAYQCLASTSLTSITNWGVYSYGVAEQALGGTGFSRYSCNVTCTNTTYFYIQPISGPSYVVGSLSGQQDVNGVFQSWGIGIDGNNQPNISFNGNELVQMNGNSVSFNNPNGNNAFQYQTNLGVTFGNGSGGSSAARVGTNGTFYGTFTGNGGGLSNLNLTLPGNTTILTTTGNGSGLTGDAPSFGVGTAALATNLVAGASITNPAIIGSATYNSAAILTNGANSSSLSAVNATNLGVAGTNQFNLFSEQSLAASFQTPPILFSTWGSPRGSGFNSNDFNTFVSGFPYYGFSFLEAYNGGGCVLVIDDGLLSQRDVNGVLTINQTNFPGLTLQGLVGLCHSNGFLLGCYFEPNPLGYNNNMTSAGYPASTGTNIEFDAMCAATNGVDFCKIDPHNCATIQQAIGYDQRFESTFRQYATNRTTYFQSDYGFAPLGPGTPNANYAYLNSALPGTLIRVVNEFSGSANTNSDWTNFLTTRFQFAQTLQAMNHQGQWMCEDEAYNALGISQNTAELSMNTLAICGSPFIYYNILQPSSTSQCFLTNAERIDIAYDSAWNVGKTVAGGTNIYGGTGNYQIAVKNMADGSKAMLFINCCTNSATTMGIQWTNIGWTAGRYSLVRDVGGLDSQLNVYGPTNYGFYYSGFTNTLPAMSSMLFRVIPVDTAIVKAISYLTTNGLSFGGAGLTITGYSVSTNTAGLLVITNTIPGLGNNAIVLGTNQISFWQNNSQMMSITNNGTWPVILFGDRAQGLVNFSGIGMNYGLGLPPTTVICGNNTTAGSLIPLSFYDPHFNHYAAIGFYGTNTLQQEAAGDLAITGDGGSDGNAGFMLRYNAPTFRANQQGVSINSTNTSTGNALYVNGSIAGNGNPLTNLNAANLTGQVPLANLQNALTNNEASAVTIASTLTVSGGNVISGNGNGLTNLNLASLGSTSSLAGLTLPINVSGTAVTSVNVVVTNSTLPLSFVNTNSVLSVGYLILNGLTNGTGYSGISNPVVIQAINSSVAGFSVVPANPNQAVAFDLQPSGAANDSFGYGVAHMDIGNTNWSPNAGLTNGNSQSAWLTIGCGTNTYTNCFIGTRYNEGGLAEPLGFFAGYGAGGESPQMMLATNGGFAIGAYPYYNTGGSTLSLPNGLQVQLPTVGLGSEAGGIAVRQNSLGSGGTDPEILFQVVSNTSVGVIQTAKTGSSFTGSSLSLNPSGSPVTINGTNYGSAALTINGNGQISAQTNIASWNSPITSTTKTITNSASGGKAQWYFSLGLTDAATGNPSFQVQIPGMFTNTIFPTVPLLTVATYTNDYGPYPVQPGFTNTIVDTSGTGASITVINNRIVF